jgi:hypothetical protein
VKFTALVLALVIATAQAQHYNCESMGAATAGHWKALEDAPHDGAAVEVLNAYGVAPHYGLFRYDAKNKWWYEVGALSVHPEWKRGVLRDEGCMFFRPWAGDPAKYVDPTHGAQYSIKYECDAAGVPYDAKTGYCSAH